MEEANQLLFSTFSGCAADLVALCLEPDRKALFFDKQVLHCFAKRSMVHVPTRL
jgi:hypothetical protein